MTRGVALLLVCAAVAVAGCGTLQRRPTAESRSLDFAVELHRDASETASAARALLLGSATGGETAARAAALQARLADTDELIRQSVPLDSRGRRPLLDATAAARKSALDLHAGASQRARLDTNALAADLGATEARLRDVADGLDPALPPDRKPDLDRIRSALPKVGDVVPA